MKAMKKVFALLLAAILVLGLSVSAFAEDAGSSDPTESTEPAATGAGSITVENAASGQTYTAYKIFDVTLADTDSDGTKDAFSYTIATDSTWLDTVLTYMGYTKVDGKWYANTDTSHSSAITSPFTGNGLTLTLSADGTRYVVTAGDEFSAADFAEALYAAVNGYTVVDTTTVTTPASSTTYYTHEGGQYVAHESLTEFEAGVTYYTQAQADFPAGTKLSGETGGSVSATGLDLGYYFVTSSVGSLANLTTTEPNAVIYDKNEQPPFDKTVDDEDVEIGQTVNYTITGEVPSTTGYTPYIYQVSDTMGTGLTLDSNSVKVYIGTVTRDGGTITSPNATTLTTVTASAPSNDVTTYTVGSGGSEKYVYSKEVGGVTTYYSNSSCTTEVENQNLPFGDATILYTDNGFVLYFDMTEYQNDVGKAITITYSAVVNENAFVTADGNSNEATLVYSNDPNDETSTGTETDEVKVYTVDLTIDKYAYNADDTDNKNTKLSGAEFVLVKKDTTAGTETFYQATYVYTYTSDGSTVTVYSKGGTAYYTDLDCTTTATIPDGATLSAGEVADVNWVSEMKDATVVTTDDKGAATFGGLEAGTYYLRETEAPDGYNPLTSDQEVTITRTDENNTVEISGNSVSVANSAGTELPATGGIGTTIFYVVGSILVIGAAVLLITRKRMSGTEE